MKMHWSLWEINFVEILLVLDCTCMYYKKLKYLNIKNHLKYLKTLLQNYDLMHYKIHNLSGVMRKPTFCICENKGADQLRGNREADQRLCFRYTGSTITLLSKYEISSLWPSFVAVQPGLCQTRLETRTLVFSRPGSFGFCILQRQRSAVSV